MKNVCIVCEQGWIIKGKTTGERGSLQEAAVVRKWENGKGIGGITKEENKDEYILDHIGDVIINPDKILFIIPCEW